MSNTAPLGIRVVLLFGLAVLLSACGGTVRPDDEHGWMVRYQREWTDGYVERQTIWPDGRIEMWHGEVMERFTLPSDAVDRLTTALRAPVPSGRPEAEPRRTLTLPGGLPVVAAASEPDASIDLLDRLFDYHTLDPTP